MNESPNPELQDLRGELSLFRSEFHRFAERSNQQHLDTIIRDLQSRYADLFIDRHLEDARHDLGEQMVPDCPMHDQCFTHFIEFLSTTAEHIRTGEITQEMVNIYEEKIAELQSRGTFTGCPTCIGDMAALFEKQLDLMRSLGIYRQEKVKEAAITDIPGEMVVREIFEPIGNVQRFRMLKSLGTGTRSFSDLSRLTGLRAGNLLFHIRKLTESGMVLQRRERGDYIITDRGYQILLGVAALYEKLR